MHSFLSNYIHSSSRVSSRQLGAHLLTAPLSTATKNSSRQSTATCASHLHPRQLSQPSAILRSPAPSLHLLSLATSYTSCIALLQLVTRFSQSNLVSTYCDRGRNYNILENLLLSMDVQVARCCGFHGTCCALAYDLSRSQRVHAELRAAHQLRLPSQGHIAVAIDISLSIKMHSAPQSKWQFARTFRRCFDSFPHRFSARLLLTSKHTNRLLLAAGSLLGCGCLALGGLPHASTHSASAGLTCLLHLKKI